MSAGKNIVLGVTGSIAAYKAAELASLLAKRGCEVHVVMTADALRFITAVPFKVLSQHPVITDLYDEEEGWKPTHIQLADEANLLLVAPALVLPAIVMTGVATPIVPPLPGTVLALRGPGLLPCLRRRCL